MLDVQKKQLMISFDFFFCKTKSLFFLKGFFGTFVFKLPSFFFFYQKDLLFSFFFINKFFFKSFLSHFSFFYRSLFLFFFFKLKLRGLGFRIKLLSKHLVRFFIGTTNYYFFHIPLNIIVKVKRRRMLLISNNKQILTNIFLAVLSLKRLIPYKLRGFFFPRQIVLMKPGKKRF